MSSETFATSAFWKRLDTIGTDFVRLLQSEAGWRLTGTAVFLHERTNARSRLDYDIVLRRDWTTSRGTIRGFVGESAIDQTIIRDDEGWSMNGVRAPGLEGVVDIDLGFTPATNFAQVKRIALPIGCAVDFSVAWWDAGEPALVALPQHYERRSASLYWYESAGGSYRAELEVAPNGFVRHYPGLWIQP